MLGQYYYHEILRKTIIAFGTIFNDIHIRHRDGAGKETSDMRVPLAYGPMQKFLARLEQQPDLNRAVQITLPRMSFETTNIAYDATRKGGITQTFKASDGKKLRKVFMPVPYNLGFELNILVKLNDDALQIVEQILPYFQPSFNVTVDLVNVIGEKRDIPIVLDNISFQDDYEGDFATRKGGITQTFKATDGNKLRKVFMPVPYNVGFELNILVKLNDDALQIVEQILPYFQPSFNVTIDLVNVIGEKRDVPIV